MAIVKMKRLRLIALRADREELLKRLQDLGCVEIDEPEDTGDDPAWAALARPSDEALGEARERQSRVSEALEALKQYAPEKGGGFSPRPEVTRKQFLDREAYDRALRDAGALCDARRDIAALESDFGKLQAQQAALAPWLSLEIPLEDRVHPVGDRPLRDPSRRGGTGSPFGGTGAGRGALLLHLGGPGPERSVSLLPLPPERG